MRPFNPWALVIAVFVRVGVFVCFSDATKLGLGRGGAAVLPPRRQYASASASRSAFVDGSFCEFPFFCGSPRQGRSAQWVGPSSQSASDGRAFAWDSDGGDLEGFDSSGSPGQRSWYERRRSAGDSDSAEEGDDGEFASAAFAPSKPFDSWSRRPSFQRPALRPGSRRRAAYSERGSWGEDDDEDEDEDDEDEEEDEEEEDERLVINRATSSLSAASEQSWSSVSTHNAGKGSPAFGRPFSQTSFSPQWRGREAPPPASRRDASLPAQQWTSPFPSPQPNGRMPSSDFSRYFRSREGPWAEGVGGPVGLDAGLLLKSNPLVPPEAFAQLERVMPLNCGSDQVGNSVEGTRRHYMLKVAHHEEPRAFPTALSADASEEDACAKGGVWYPLEESIQEALKRASQTDWLQTIEANARVLTTEATQRRRRFEALQSTLKRYGLTRDPESWLCREFVYCRHISLQEVIFTLWRHHVLDKYYKKTLISEDDPDAENVNGLAAVESDWRNHVLWTSSIDITANPIVEFALLARKNDYFLRRFYAVTRRFPTTRFYFGQSVHPDSSGTQRSDGFRRRGMSLYGRSAGQFNREEFPQEAQGESPSVETERISEESGNFLPEETVPGGEPSETDAVSEEFPSPLEKTADASPEAETETQEKKTSSAEAELPSEPPTKSKTYSSRTRRHHVAPVSESSAEESPTESSVDTAPSVQTAAS